MTTPIITCPVCNTQYEENYEECPNCSFKTIHHQAYLAENSREPQKILNDKYGIFTVKSFIVFLLFSLSITRVIMAVYDISLQDLINYIY